MSDTPDLPASGGTGQTPIPLVKYSPTQPRVSQGNSDGGQWTDGGGGSGSSGISSSRDSSSRSSSSDPSESSRVLSDADPDDFIEPGTQTAGRRPLRRRNTQATAGTAQAEYVRQLAADRMGEALLRARQLDPEWKPQPRAYDPNNIEAETSAYREIAQEANARASYLERGGVPHGFGSRAEFEDFGRGTRTMLENAGYPEAEVYLRGSSITGYKFTDGLPFDRGLRPSDLDLAIVSARLFEAARDVRVPRLGNNTRTVPLNVTKLRELGLDNVIKEIKINRGRDASIVIFQSQEALEARGASTLVTAVRRPK